MNEAKIGYEIFPDRFKKTGNTDKTLRSWNTKVKAHNDQEYDFYGGNLKGIASKVDYIEKLGIDFVYLTPILKATTNHRYDTTDYLSLDPLIGDEKDLAKLSEKLHKKNIRLILDIVLNHVGKTHHWFQGALNNEKSSKYFCKKEHDFLRWWDVDNLPELNLENKELREFLWEGKNSVIEKWTNLGVNDWRIDCAYDIGYKYCKSITAKMKSLGDHNTYGEIWSYPKKWISNDVMTGVMNYFYRDLITSFLLGNAKGSHIAEILNDTVADCGSENLLKSWNVLSSHDTARIKNTFGDLWKPAVALQFTLPGSPLIYYGEELGMEGETDPYCRQPMIWPLAHSENETLNFYKNIIGLFKSSPALRHGNFNKTYTETNSILSFARNTEKIRDFKLIVINPTDYETSFQIYLKESSLMNCTHLTDHFGGEKLWVTSSRINGSIKAKSFGIYYPETENIKYTPYKRID